MILIEENAKMALTRHCFPIHVLQTMHNSEEKSMTGSFIRGGIAFFF